MPKRIIVLSDGTGNAVANVWKSNVWRMFEALDLSRSEQVAAYDDGVGTSSFKPLAILGGAFGWGLKRNVLDLYKFICRNYQPDADIYGFGFSRGAFTIRVLIGLVLNQGLIPAKHISASELDRLAKDAYRAYRKERYHSFLRVELPFRFLRDLAVSFKNLVAGNNAYDRNKNTQVEAVTFLGLWDTVAAYGLPIDEMTRGVSQWIWPLELPDRKLTHRVERACHALSLDDERTTFHPVLWTEETEKPEIVAGAKNINDERISQVWFAGVHTNVGGGYPDDRLAQIPLIWMMREAIKAGLLFKASPHAPANADPDGLEKAKLAADKEGRLYDSRAGLGGYYRYGPRKLADLCNTALLGPKSDSVSIDVPKIHVSALHRMRGNNDYAPIGIPARYAVVDDNGDILRAGQHQFETPAQSAARDRLQEDIWDKVWQRRFVYFATIAASAHLLLFPLIHQINRAHEYESPIRIVSEITRFLGAFLPNLASFWINAFAGRPGTSLIGLLAVVALILLNVMLSAQINDRMTRIWRDGAVTAPECDSLIYKLRTSRAYRSMVRTLKFYVFPFLFAIGVLYVGLAVLSHLVFNVRDAAGAYCRPSSQFYTLVGGETRETQQPLATDSICWGTGISLVEGERYRIELKQIAPWKDKQIEAGLEGFEIGELPTFGERFAMTVAIPLRRVLLRRWFLPIARIGDKGTDEYFIDPPAASPLNTPKRDIASATFRARRSGELFLYVNDAGLAIPGLSDFFYRNNKGTASVTVRHVSR